MALRRVIPRVPQRGNLREPRATPWVRCVNGSFSPNGARCGWRMVVIRQVVVTRGPVPPFQGSGNLISARPPRALPWAGAGRPGGPAVSALRACQIVLGSCNDPNLTIGATSYRASGLGKCEHHRRRDTPGSTVDRWWRVFRSECSFLLPSSVVVGPCFHRAREMRHPRDIGRWSRFDFWEERRTAELGSAREFVGPSRRWEAIVVWYSALANPRWLATHRSAFPLL